MTPRVINDEYSTIESRQARYQARKRSSGLCIQCGKGKLVDKNHCEVCRDRARVLNKESRERKLKGEAND